MDEGDKKNKSSDTKTGDSLGDGQEVRVVDRRFWKRSDWNVEDRSVSRLPTVVEDMERRLQEGESQLREVRDRARKVQEESDAYRTRLERDVSRKVAQSRSEFMRDMLDVLDDLERTLQAPHSPDEPARALATFMEGVELTRRSFLDRLARQGVKRIEMLGSPFNPETAEALDVTETTEPDQDNKILEIFQEGYEMEGRVIRPARVRVAKCKQAASDTSPNQETENE